MAIYGVSQLCGKAKEWRLETVVTRAAIMSVTSTRYHDTARRVLTCGPGYLVPVLDPTKTPFWKVFGSGWSVVLSWSDVARLSAVRK